MIIEAIFENLHVKRALFARLEAAAKPGAILATNTSSLKLADISANFADPSRLVGIHFFNPVPQMQLVEIVSGSNTDPETAKNAAAFVRQIDKLPLHVKDSPGFLVNRVLGPYLNQALKMADEGASPETLDAAMTRFGMPMGPIELVDTVGLDICMAAGKALAAGNAEPPKKIAEFVAAGNLGKKSGRGFYLWQNGKAHKGAVGAVTPELIERLIAPYLKEAQAVFAEGIVADAGLIFLQAPETHRPADERVHSAVISDTSPLSSSAWRRKRLACKDEAVTSANPVRAIRALASGSASSSRHPFTSPSNGTAYVPASRPVSSPRSEISLTTALRFARRYKSRGTSVSPPSTWCTFKTTLALAIQ